MQHVMQNNCAVFRTGEVLNEGQNLIHKVHGGVGDISVVATARWCGIPT